MAKIVETKKRKDKKRVYSIIYISTALVGTLIFLGYAISVFINKTISFSIISFIVIFLVCAGIEYVSITYKKKYKTSVMNAEGKDKMMDILKTLPKEYIILQDIDYDQEQYDYIVLSNQGICVIDLNNETGTVRGRKNEKEWEIQEEKYALALKNPVDFLNTKMDTLKSLNPNVYGYVFFTNANVHTNCDNVHTSKNRLLSDIKNHKKGNIANQELEIIQQKLSGSL